MAECVYGTVGGFRSYIFDKREAPGLIMEELGITSIIIREEYARVTEFLLSPIHSSSSSFKYLTVMATASRHAFTF